MAEMSSISNSYATPRVDDRWICKHLQRHRNRHDNATPRTTSASELEALADRRRLVDSVRTRYPRLGWVPNVTHAGAGASCRRSTPASAALARDRRGAPAAGRRGKSNETVLLRPVRARDLNQRRNASIGAAKR